MRLYARQPIGTVPRARQLRRDAPEPERRLLRALRETFPSLKWRHQTPVGPYFVDILCFSEALGIEVDGDTHASAERYDAARTRFIEREGYRVQRFWNNEVMQNLDGVIATVANPLSQREHRVNSAPRCLDRSGGTIDPMLEGAAKRRKGEGSTVRREAIDLPSPSHAAARRGPLPLPEGEEL